jgi:hypothetical protein
MEEHHDLADSDFGVLNDRVKRSRSHRGCVLMMCRASTRTARSHC